MLYVNPNLIEFSFYLFQNPNTRYLTGTQWASGHQFELTWTLVKKFPGSTRACTPQRQLIEIQLLVKDLSNRTITADQSFTLFRSKLWHLHPGLQAQDSKTFLGFLPQKVCWINLLFAIPEEDMNNGHCTVPKGSYGHICFTFRSREKKFGQDVHLRNLTNNGQRQLLIQKSLE